MHQTSLGDPPAPDGPAGEVNRGWGEVGGEGEKRGRRKIREGNKSWGVF